MNGIPPSRSAVEVRLHKDDNLWWDYRSWRNPNEVQAVVGAFPQPFLRGPAVVVGSGALATKLAHARSRDAWRAALPRTRTSSSFAPATAFAPSTRTVLS